MSTKLKPAETSSGEQTIEHSIGEEKFQLEILQQFPVQSDVFRVATMSDEMFALCMPENQDPFINVCDRNNMALVTDVIPLPGMLPEDMAGCSVSNCVYVLVKEPPFYLVLRITRNEDHQFIVSPWLNDLNLSFDTMRLFVSVSGNLIVLSNTVAPSSCVVSVYSADGTIESALSLFPPAYGFKTIFGVILKANGNFVLATISDDLKTELKEIDPIGKIVRQFKSSLSGDNGVIDADVDGRIMIAGVGNKAELLDSDFKLLDVAVSTENENLIQIPFGMHYNSERNEIMRLFEFDNGKRALTIFHFTGK